MKKTIVQIVLSTILCMAASMMSGQTPSLVEGENLDIGNGNNLGISGLKLKGNAIGNKNTVLSDYALTVGKADSICSASEFAVTIGSHNRLQGFSSMAFGSYLRVNGDRGMAIGSGIFVNRTNINETFFPLANDTANSLVVGFNSTKPTLFVSESPNDPGDDILDRTGRVAIGNVAPLHKLHIRSDVGEDASLMLERGEPRESCAFIQLGDTSHKILVDSLGDMLVSAGDYSTLDVVSSNFKVNASQASLGMSANTRLYLSSKADPSLSVNAKPVATGYERGTSGPSYAMEFGGNAFRLRTAVFMEPRGDLITNWTTPVTVTTAGVVTLNGKVGVNIENTTQDYALAVDGGVITTKVHIQEVVDWQDRVFGDGYRLMPLGEVEAYVAAHRHLPGVPSEAEVKADGFDMAEMQAALLGKIEELVLYTIRQQKEIDSLRDLVTMSFGYDACGNRVSRTLEFSKTEGGRSTMDGGLPNDGAPQWQASLTDNFGNAEAMLFPNPTEGGFFLSMAGDGLPGSTTATLCAVDGTVLEERTAIGVNEEFDLGGRPAGVYLLRLTSGDEMKVWKVVKRK